MNILKRSVIILALTFIISMDLNAQRMDTLTLPQRQILTDALASHPFSPKKQVFYDPLIGNYTIEPNGVTSDRGHFFIRMKEPDRSRVIPMPETRLKLAPFSNLNASPFSALPKQKPPAILNKE